MRVLLTLGCALLVGCAQTPVQRSGKPMQFDALHPGGPIYQPTEVLVGEPMPAEPPFGKYFANDQPSAPAEIADPYWVNGYWGWKDPDWDWIPGRWVDRPRPGLIWINPRYYQTGGQRYWLSGYWE